VREPKLEPKQKLLYLVFNDEVGEKALNGTVYIIVNVSALTVIRNLMQLGMIKADKL
jgi:hypothetical protein